MIISPLIFIIFYRFKLKKLENVYMIQTLFEDLIENNKNALKYSLVFVLRRMFILLLIFLLPDYPVIQIILSMLLSTIFLVYLIHVKPFEFMGQNLLEIFNEYMVFLIITISILFNDTIQDNDSLNKIGWIVIDFALLAFYVNIIVIFF